MESRIVFLILKGCTKAKNPNHPYTQAEIKLLKKFGAAARELRRKIGITQEELAFRANLDRTYIGGIERGERNVSIINIMRIAAALEVTPEKLFSAIDP